jgi:hypothetical protein
MMGSKCMGLEAGVQKRDRDGEINYISQMLVGLDAEFEWGQ